MKKCIIYIKFTDGQTEIYQCKQGTEPIVKDRILIIETDTGLIEFKLDIINIWERSYRIVDNDVKF
jgi:hypothetical protein